MCPIDPTGGTKISYKLSARIKISAWIGGLTLSSLLWALFLTDVGWFCPGDTRSFLGKILFAASIPWFTGFFIFGLAAACTGFKEEKFGVAAKVATGVFFFTFFLMTNKHCGPSPLPTEPSSLNEDTRELSDKAEAENAVAKYMRELSDRAESGEALAQYMMGRESADLGSKLKWFCLAAHNGDAAALYGLARLYHKELPSDKRDPIKAYQYFLLGELAMPASADYLAPGLRELPIKMSDVQLKAARAAAKNWKPSPVSCPN